MRTISQQLGLEWVADDQSLKNMLVHDLLRGVALDEGTYLRQARRLGLDLARPRVVILLDASDYISAHDGPAGWGSHLRAPAQQRLAGLLEIVARHCGDAGESIYAYTGDGEIAVLRTCSPGHSAARGRDTAQPAGEQLYAAQPAAAERFAADFLLKISGATGANMHAGIGRYHSGSASLAQSYRDAHMAVTLGHSLCPGEPIHSLYSVALPAFLGNSDARTKATLARLILRPIEAAPDLMDTLRVFFAEDGSHSISALRLNIHRNTLTCRLDKIAQLTGLDPRKHFDSLQLALSLHLTKGPSHLTRERA